MFILDTNNMNLAWVGPFSFRHLLEHCLNDDQAWPPPGRAVYLVTQRPWSMAPTRDAGPLYFGANTGESDRFCTRIGDLIADLFGFWDGGTGHHSGGQKLYNWCKESNTHPSDLYLAWATSANWCARCAENALADLVAPNWAARRANGLLNGNRPPTCGLHAR